MITKSILDMLEMEDIYDYYWEVMDTLSGGHYDKAREMFKQMSTDQQIRFFDWQEATYFYEAEDNK